MCKYINIYISIHVYMYIYTYTYIYIYNFVETWGSFAEVVCASVCARKFGALLRKSRALLRKNQLFRHCTFCMNENTCASILSCFFLPPFFGEEKRAVDIEVCTCVFVCACVCVCVYVYIVCVH